MRRSIRLIYAGSGKTASLGKDFASLEARIQDVLRNDFDYEGTKVHIEPLPDEIFINVSGIRERNQKVNKDALRDRLRVVRGAVHKALYQEYKKVINTTEPYWIGTTWHASINPDHILP